MVLPCRDLGMGLQFRKEHFWQEIQSVGCLWLCTEALFIVEIVRFAAAISM